MTRVFLLLAVAAFVASGGCAPKTASSLPPPAPVAATSPPISSQVQPIVVSPALESPKRDEASAPEATASITKYLDDHVALLSRENPKWMEAIKNLQESGDDFTLSLLDEIANRDLSPEDKTLLDETRQKIKAAAHTRKLDVQALLERAAHADLMCNPLETRLKDWTLKYVGRNLDEPEIREELAKIRDHYEPRRGAKTLFGSMKERVPSYAKTILAKAPEPNKKP